MPLGSKAGSCVRWAASLRLQLRKMKAAATNAACILIGLFMAPMATCFVPGASLPRANIALRPTAARPSMALSAAPFTTIGASAKAATALSTSAATAQILVLPAGICFPYPFHRTAQPSCLSGICRESSFLRFLLARSRILSPPRDERWPSRKKTTLAAGGFPG